MNSSKHKPQDVTRTPAQFQRPSAGVESRRRGVVQQMTPPSAQSIKRPIAPPVYRPQQVPKVLQSKISQAQNHQAVQARRQPVAPQVYRPESKKLIQPKVMLRSQNSPIAQQVYRPELQRVVQPKLTLTAQVHVPPKGPSVYRPQARPTNVQARMATTSQVKNHPLAPPVYCPQPVPKVLQTRKSVTQPAVERQNEHTRITTPVPIVSQISASRRNAQSAAKTPVHQSVPRHLTRFNHSHPVGDRTIQRVVDPSRSDVTSTGKYLVEHDNLSVLYSTLDAEHPQPLGLYVRGVDYIPGMFGNIPLNSWTPNVRFIDKAEAQAEPVLDHPGTYSYRAMGELGAERTFNINELQTGVWNPNPGVGRPPTVGALGKNDCNIWATTLQNLIAVETGRRYQRERGYEVSRSVNMLSPVTTESDLNVNVGDLMKHNYQGEGACNYHAATVVAKDGPSLVTLEGHVSKNLSKPQFHVRGGLAGFAAEGIQHHKGDQVDVVPVTSLTDVGVQSDVEKREERFRRFGTIDPGDWRYYERKHHTYRGMLVGDIGITPTLSRVREIERARQERIAYDNALSESLARRVRRPINSGRDEGNTFILNDML